MLLVWQGVAGAEDEVVRLSRARLTVCGAGTFNAATTGVAACLGMDLCF